MAEQSVARKLAAIFYADVAGYSSLTGADEEGTHRTVAEYFDCIAGVVSGHDGRVVHYAGDAVLADFASVVAAVKCAVAVQKDLTARNVGIPEERKVQFRIGVNLGDVIVDRNDIYGDGVNVAARLETLADPGGICVSRKVLDEVRGKVDVGFEDIGPQNFKNIAEPVQTYRVVLEQPSVATPPRTLPDKSRVSRDSERVHAAESWKFKVHFSLEVGFRSTTAQPSWDVAVQASPFSLFQRGHWQLPGAVLRKRIFGHQGLMFGATLLAIFIFVALFAPLISPHDPYDQQLARKLIPPIWHDSPRATWEHVLGTDALGRDYLSRLFYGARISLLIGFAATLISGILGTTLGMLGGYYGGRVDLVVNYLITTRYALPVVLVALTACSLIGSSLTVVIWVLGLLIWDRFAVVIRSATQQLRNLDFVAAAEALGCSTQRILLTEILPNIAHYLIIIVSIEMAHAIVFEATLSFLGLGVQPPAPSWGLMLAEGKRFMFFDTWLIAIPGAALFALVLSISLLGDGVYDMTAPEERS